MSTAQHAADVQFAIDYPHLPSRKLTVRPWKSMVGRWNSFWEGLYSQLLPVSFGDVIWAQAQNYHVKPVGPKHPLWNSISCTRKGWTGFPKRENDGFQNETPDFQGLLFQVNHIKLQGIYIYTFYTLFRTTSSTKTNRKIGSLQLTSVWSRLQTQHVWKSKGMVFPGPP